jgi:ABC-type amino acid transport substrate-binding protein
MANAMSKPVDLNQLVTIRQKAQRGLLRLTIYSGLGILFGVLWANVASGQVLRTAVANNQPIAHYTQQQLSGVIAVSSAQVLEQMGYSLDVQVMPFKRAYYAVHRGDIDLAMSVLATPERRQKAYYSDPIITEYTLILVPRGKGVAVTRLSDLSGMRLGAMLGFKYPTLEGSAVRLNRSNDLKKHFKSLAKGHLDGILMGSITGSYMIDELGLQESFEFLPMAVAQVPLGIAVSHGAWNTTQMSSFNKRMSVFKQSQAWQDILTTHSAAQWVKSWPLTGR